MSWLMPEDPPVVGKSFSLRRNYKLLTWERAPVPLQFNVYIRTGYRAFLNTPQCLSSLFHFHNETFNVWTHFIGVFLFTYFAYECRNDGMEGALEWFLFACQYVSAVAVCLASSTYHLFMCHGECSRRSYNFWLRCDLIGILIGYLLSTVRRLWYGLYCFPAWRSFAAAVFVGGIVAVMSLLASGLAMHSVLSRIGTFGILIGAINFSLILQMYLGAGDPMAQRLYVAAIACQMVGGVINAKRIPERFFQSPVLDFIGNSHQIWHLVTLGAMLACWVATNLDFYASKQPCSA